MKFSLQLSALALAGAALGAATVRTTTTTGPQFDKGQPIDGNGKGAPLLGTHATPLLMPHSQPIN